MEAKNPITDWKNRKGNARKTIKKIVKKLNGQKGKKLDALAQSTHEQVFERVDCLDCANCCTSIPPIVNRTDTNRIAKLLGMKPNQFEKEYLLIDEDGDTVMNQSPCPFLLEDHKCFIYEHRPKACRAYPHTDFDQFSNNLNLHEKNYKICPAVFHILESLNEQL